MYEAKTAAFFYCVSPVHMGAGTALGAVDNPIQRERHTEHPIMIGSGLKGAVRHRFKASGESEDGLIERIFGPDPEKSDLHAGAVSFGDAQIVLFPVRCLKEAYVYATSPVALSRLLRLLDIVGVEGPGVETVPQPKEGTAVVLDEQLLADDKLILEAYALEARGEGQEDLGRIAEWLAEHAVPARPGFFKSKIQKHLVLLDENTFSHFVRHATVVEPHVRIDDETGAAQDGGLFYTENLPPESLLVAPVMASRDRSGTQDDSGKDPLGAADILTHLSRGIDGQTIQVGGDATTGRGQVVVRFGSRTAGTEG